ncbi:MAG: hypothetical protein ACT4O1_10365 [Gemmatimonadota bacterium]
MRGGYLPWLMPMLVLVLGCAGPESERHRGGGPGADPGNRRRIIKMHEGAEPYYDTPCAMRPKECSGPLPVFGATLDKPA